MERRLPSHGASTAPRQPGLGQRAASAVCTPLCTLESVIAAAAAHTVALQSSSHAQLPQQRAGAARQLQSFTSAGGGKRRKRGPQSSLVGNSGCSGSDLRLSLEWPDALQLLQGHGPWAASAMPRRPDFLTIGSVRQIFVEVPRHRRRAGTDRWLNSGGLKGATTHWFDESIGIRLRYGKIACARTDNSVKFVELTKLTNHSAPVEVKVRSPSGGGSSSSGSSSSSGGGGSSSSSSSSSSSLCISLIVGVALHVCAGQDGLHCRGCHQC
jgi:hypothetical protein